MTWREKGGDYWLGDDYCISQGRDLFGTEKFWCFYRGDEIGTAPTLAKAKDICRAFRPSPKPHRSDK